MFAKISVDEHRINNYHMHFTSLEVLGPLRFVIALYILCRTFLGGLRICLEFFIAKMGFPPQWWKKKWRTWHVGKEKHQQYIEIYRLYIPLLVYLVNVELLVVTSTPGLLFLHLPCILRLTANSCLTKGMCLRMRYPQKGTSSPRINSWESRLAKGVKTSKELTFMVKMRWNPQTPTNWSVRPSADRRGRLYLTATGG